MPVLCEKAGEHHVRLTVYTSRGEIYKSAAIQIPYTSYVGANSQYICSRVENEYVIQDYSLKIITRRVMPAGNAEMNEYYCVIASDSITYYSFEKHVWSTLPHAARAIGLAEDCILSFVSDTTNKHTAINLKTGHTMKTLPFKACEDAKMFPFINVCSSPQANCPKCLTSAWPNYVGGKSHIFYTKNPETQEVKFYSTVLGTISPLLTTRGKCNFEALNCGFIVIDPGAPCVIHDDGRDILVKTQTAGVYIFRK